MKNNSQLKKSVYLKVFSDTGKVFNEISIYEQKGGQFVSPRTFTGFKAKIFSWIINKYFLRI